MIRQDEWKPAGSIILEPNAMRAVRELASNVVVAAGPGAGKTELLAQRADFLLTTGACRFPYRILAISFKADAAQNIRERVRKRCGEQISVRFDSFTFHAFAKRIIDNYRLVLTGDDALDPDYTIDQDNGIPPTGIKFTDMVPLAIKILQNSPDARNAIRKTYTHVFLDEFQDATGEQYSLVKEAFLNGDAVLTAVGDVKQRIMSWAGALDGIMQTFSTDFAAQSLTLYQNYRSEPVLRRMQNRMVTVMDPQAAVSPIELAGTGGSIEVLSFDTSWDEAVEIANRIKGWLEVHVSPAEIAILVRQQPDLVCEQLIQELNNRGIASRNERAHQELTAEPVAALVLSLIRVLADCRQSASYERLMHVITRSSLTEERALRSSRALSRFLETERERFRSSTKARSDPAEWDSVISKFVTLVTGPVLEALSPEYQSGNRFDQILQETTTAFKQELAKDGDPIAAMMRLSEENAVRIMTIHKSKGLEFEKVVVCGVEKEFFWGGKIGNYRSEFFVAVSRAKDELILTHARERPRPSMALGRWEERRNPMQEFLDYANES